MSEFKITCQHLAPGTTGVIDRFENGKPVVRWSDGQEMTAPKFMRNLKYRGFEIEPGYSAFAPWVFAVEGYDGAPDAGPGNVCGHADRLEDVPGAIDELIELYDLAEESSAAV